MTDHPDIVERLTELADGYEEIAELDEAAAEITRLRAEAEALRKDAERYRWLLAEHERIDPMAAIVWKWKCERSSSEWVNSASPQSINEHIDTQLRAAIAATKEQQA